MEHNKYAAVSEYDYKMIDAYLGKPEVTDWYVNAFKKFTVNGVSVMRWHWSWWAFFGNVFYLLYRKAYLPAGILLLLFVFIGMIPFGGLILWILTGGYAPYFVFKSYKEQKDTVEATISEDEKRLETMALIGGPNEWAIWVGIIVHLFVWGFILSMFGVLLAMIGIAAAGSS